LLFLDAVDDHFVHVFELGFYLGGYSFVTLVHLLYNSCVIWVPCIFRLSLKHPEILQLTFLQLIIAFVQRFK
jgi:hypothetical protein